jgi:hypothetical protein
MGQNQPLAITEEEKAELSIGLIREWWITATQMLAEVAGSEKALELLKPYFVNMGKAGSINIRTLTKGAVVGRLTGGWIQRCAVGGISGQTFRAGDGTSIEELLECKTEGKSREACICLCSYCMSAGAEEWNSNWEYVLLESLSLGDLKCKWLTKWKARPSLVAEREEFISHEFDALPEEITDDIAEYLGLSMVGEMVVNCTKAFIDFAGSGEAVKKLKAKMESSGISVGKRLASKFEVHELDTTAIINIFILLNKIHQREGSLSASHEYAEGTITKCPFSDAPNEFCHLHESFCNGICEAIDSTYEFSYDRMMTKGDKACHWTIRKKGEVAKESGETALELLKKRLVKGEITPEQYRQLMDILLEN